MSGETGGGDTSTQEILVDLADKVQLFEQGSIDLHLILVLASL